MAYTVHAVWRWRCVYPSPILSRTLSSILTYPSRPCLSPSFASYLSSSLSSHLSPHLFPSLLLSLPIAKKDLYEGDWAQWTQELNAKGLTLNGDMM